MYRITFIIFLVIFFCESQALSQVNFEKFIWGENYYHTYPSQMINLSTNEYLLTGGTRIHGGFTGNTFLYKFDNFGNMLWSKRYPSHGGFFAAAPFVAELKSGKYLTSGGGTDFYQGLGDVYSFFTIHDTSGNELQTTFYGGNDFNFYLMNVIGNSEGGFTSVGYKDIITHFSAIIIKCDSNGSVITSRTYLDTITNYSKFNYFQEIVQSSDSSYYVLAINQRRPIIMHLNKDCDSLETIPLNDSLGVNEMNKIADLKLFNDNLTGLLSTYDTTGGHYIRTSYFNYNITSQHTTFKIASTGLYKLFPLDNGEKVVLGACPNAFPNSVNTFMEKRDSNDVAIWSFCIHPQLQAQIIADKFNRSNDGGYLIGCELDTGNYGLYESIYALKVDSNGQFFTSISDDGPDYNLNIYPNPVKTKLHITADPFDIDGIELFDISGRHIALLFRDDENNFDLMNFSPGTYIIKFAVNDRIISRIVFKE
jgi:hypothetical protein